ncbi:protein split ends isoform X1 [Mycetomoellerius zeteki]|uniref:protein split ends isoform X1 n=1 Tax=Mycetomoellerius zeteki TaxID=64791 RepID=UPI00084ECAAA|nr:PREDICTED: protein split ends isoform X1 [Trachymyrmex zeteki]
MGGYAWVTLATNDAYSLGALVLAHSLRRVGTKHELACLVTPGVTATMREKLAAVFSLVQEVNVLDSKDEANLALLARPELGITFTKLHCWRLTQYEKCVFVDADTLVVRNCDELFEREELSAAPDVGWPDCFNSGVFVFRPSQQTFASITAFAAAKGSFDGGDQGLLNMYFSDWASKDISKHLPFIYNMCSTATYSYLPAFKQFGDDVRIIHFIGITKPWLQYFDTLTGTVQPPPGSTHLQPLLQLWWNIFCERVHPQLSSSMATSTLAPIWHAFAPPSYVPPFPEISDYSDATNSNSSRVPDFSEFKDPWEEYSPRNDPFPTDNSALNDKSDNCYCGVKEADAVRQSDHSASQLAHNQQFHYEQQHSSYTPIQTYDQRQEHATSHFEETRNQEHSVQHTEHHQHWQQHSEHKRHDEQHQHEQWTEQRHHHVQHQHHEHRHNEQQHYNEQKQHSEHHQQFHQQFHQHDYHRNKADDHHQNQSTEAGHENHAQHYSSDNSHQNADHLSHTASHNEQYTSNQDARDNFASHCYRCIEKNSEQSSEAVNKQTDTRRIDFLPPSPEPCTDLHNVATRSDPNVTEHLDNANAGIAGALAQLTLGEARSAEQVAFEEHMRKQSWEQGQIDYMGRDSFDNIWKKICETLSLAPQREPTPPTEDTATLETAVQETAAKETATKETADTPIDVKVDKPAVEVDKDPTQSLICEVPKEEKFSAAIPEQKAPALSSDKSAEATAKISEPVQFEDVCAKPTTELKDVKSCEIRTEVPLPQPPAEPLLARTTAEPCELPSLQTPQEAALRSAILLLETKEPKQQTDSQTSPLVCKMPVQETTAPVTQIGAESALTEAKPKTPAFIAQDATQPIALTGVGSPQIAATSPVASQAPVEDTVKCVIESAPDVTQPLTIDPGELHAEMLLAASEISTVSPVPIQVAESVLQAEPKESVLGAAVTVSDQAIASMVTAMHKSKDIASAPTPTEPVQLNGSACEIERRDISGLPEKTDAPSEAIKEFASDLVATKDLPAEAAPATEEKILTSSSVGPLEKSSVEELMEQVAKIKLAEVKPPEQKPKTEEIKPPELITKTEAVEEKSAEQAAKAETTEAIVKQAETVAQAEITKVPSIEQTEATEAATAKLPKVLASPIAEQSPPAEEPIEAKPPNVPSTPTVTEASPPISPSVESAQEMEDAAKKSLKKSDSADGTDGEGADKKAAKRTVKKVTKKPKAKPEEAAPSTATEGAAADGSQSKTKKTVKTTKKIGAKTLETDTSIPETPPPPTPTGAVGVDAPVPPKRKTKSTNAKGTGKKPETEE